MKNIFSSFIVAMSMFSTIPMPNVEWSKENMKYMFCFLPIVGVLIFGAEYAWFFVANYYGFNTIFYAGIATVIPLVISGGIHIDGFIDTCDARMSMASVERRKEILKDPHVGAFAVIYTIAYFIIIFSAYTELYKSIIPVMFVSFGYIVSRAVGSFLAINMSHNNSNGMLKTFYTNSSVAISSTFTLSYIIVFAILISLYESYVPEFICMAVILLVSFILFKRMAKNKFGGVSGDLIGYYVSIIELLFALVGVVSIVGVI